MAKNYQRHSKGGRFKRADIGDAGISSLRQQQQNIIDAIKLQRAQDKDISSGHLAGLRRTAETEAQNRNALANLEDSIYSVKRENIQKRQKTEVERLEDQAKEYQKQADFWKDFSTTYAKQYGEAAKEVWDFKDRLWADKHAQFVLDQIPGQINFKADNIREGAHLILEDSLRKSAQVKLDKADKEGQKEIVKEQKAILSTMNRSNKYLDDIKVRAFTNEINQIEENLKRTIMESPDLKWEPDTIIGHYEQAAKNLIIKSSIRTNSSAARQLHALFIRKGTAAAHKLDLKQDAILDKEKIDTNALAIPALPLEKQPQALKELFFNVKNATRQNKDGTFSIGISDGTAGYKEAYWGTAQVLAEHYTDKDAFVEAMQSMRVDSGKKGGGDVAWNVRFAKQEASERLLLEKYWDDAHKDTLTKKERQKKLDDLAGVAKIEEVLSDPKFDITSTAGQKIIDELEKQHLGPKSQQLIRTISIFDFEGKNKIYLDQQIIKAWKDGRPDEFAELYALVNQSTKEKFDALKLDMDDLRNAPGYRDGKGVNTYATERIKSIIGNENVFKRDIDLHDRIIVAYEDAFYKKFRETKGTPSERWNEAQNYADEQLDKGLGAFRREGSGGETVWLAFAVEDTSKDYDPIDLDLKLSTTESAVNTTIDNIITSHQNAAKGKPGKEIVALDTIDEMVLSINRGETVEAPYALQKIFYSQTGPKEKWKYETIEDLAGAILGTKVPEGAFSLYKFIDKKAPLKVPNIQKYTSKEQAFLNAARLEFDEWPVETALGNIINSAGGLEFISDEDDYAALNDPQRNPLLYFGNTIPDFLTQ